MKTLWTSFLHYYNYRIMKMTTDTPALIVAATAFAALGSEHRLTILRRLVRAGPDGIPMGALGDSVGITGSVLTHHLKQLVSAGLVIQRRDGRRILCAVDYDQIRAVSDYLLQECCADTGPDEQGGQHD
jgi:ArsR family transcriptional regulator, arsenate/arsenite/antimonite-responsive transcriptional repressor